MEAMPIEWLQSIPPVTRIYALTSFALSVGERFGYIQVSDILLKSNSSGSSYKDMSILWRVPLNAIYSGTLSFRFMTRLFYFTQQSIWLENTQNSARDFVWMIFVLVVLINLYSIFVVNIPFIGPVLSEVFQYIWTRKNDDAQIFLMFLIIPGPWFPWISFLMTCTMSYQIDRKFILTQLAGIIIGHTYWFVDEQLPILHKSKSWFRPIWKWDFFNPTDGDAVLRIEEEHAPGVAQQEEPLHQEEQHEQLENNNPADIPADLELIDETENIGFQREAEQALQQRR